MQVKAVQEQASHVLQDTVRVDHPVPNVALDFIQQLAQNHVHLVELVNTLQAQVQQV